jgi:hypothetical protein
MSLTIATAGESPDERMFFPRNSVRGYLGFEVAPPHNEIDMNLCIPNGPVTSVPCAGFARYTWGGYVEVQPVGRGAFKHVFLFMDPKVFGGDTIPQKQYSWAASAILWEHVYGLGVELPRNFELRITHHGTVRLGRYRQDSVLTLRPDGPYGLYSTVGMRWYFGGYGRAASGAR